MPQSTVARWPSSSSWLVSSCCCTPVIEVNNTAARCGVEPLPDEPYVNCPGRLLPNVMRSFTLCSGIDGCTTSIIPAVAAIVTGANARCES